MSRAALLTRLQKLEAPRRSGERPGMLAMPSILPLDQWEALAEASQAALAGATRAGLEPPRPALPDPMVHRVSR